MSVKATPQSAAAAWQTGMQGATQKYTDGINSVTVAPGQLAAAAADLWAINVANAKSKFATNVGAVDVNTWKNQAISKGAPRLASGATAALPKVQKFQANFLPVLKSVVDSLPARGDTNANIQRAVAYMQTLSQKKGQF